MRNEKPHRFGEQIRINTFFPPYPSVAFERFCQTIVQRSRIPLSVYIALTPKCPYKCEHCSYQRRSNSELSHQQFLDIIKQVKALGTSIVGFTGGEPLLRDDLAELVAAAKPEMATIVFTSGYGLDATKAKQLADAQCDCVTVGFESAEPAVHDRIRGSEGSFAIAEKAVETAQEQGLYTAISTVGTRERLFSEELQKLYDLACKWNVGEFRLLAPVATGGQAGCAAFMLSEQEYQALADFHIDHNRKQGGPAVASFAYLESNQMFGCGAGYHHLFIDATGEVNPCDLTPLSFGNAVEDPLAEIWQRMSDTFPHPRCGCLMSKLAEKIGPEPLPLSPERSKELCPAPDKNTPLPEGYRRLLKSRKQ